MLMLILYLFQNLGRVFLYFFEIKIWRNKKIDPTAKALKRRTFFKVIFNISEVTLFFIFLFLQIISSKDGIKNGFELLKSRFTCANKVYEGLNYNIVAIEMNVFYFFMGRAALYLVCYILYYSLILCIYCKLGKSKEQDQY